MKKLTRFLVIAFALAAAARAAAAPLITPAPKQMEWLGEARATKSYVISADAMTPSSVVGEYKSKLAEWGFKAGDGGVGISLTRLPIAECDKIATPPYQKKLPLDYTSLQTYFLEVGDAKVDVRACGEDGFFYALTTLRRLWADAEGGLVLQKVKIADWPDFPVRGIFEGGYGIWDMEGRLNTIDWMGEAKLNTYIYGPKGDPKIRRQWRALYTDMEMFQFRRIMQALKENHIQFSYVVAPILGMEYGSDADLKALVRKLRQMQSVGARGFIIAFDDTLGTLYYQRDRERFANLGEAEAYLTTRVHEELKKFDPNVMVGMVPEIYAGVHDMAYTRSVAKLPLDIYIGWTGSEIVAPKIDAASMKKFIDFYGRMPSLGDNWGSPFPLVGRHADVFKYTTQFLVNPYSLQGELPIPDMEAASEPELMPIAGAAVAEYSWNPAAYDVEKTLDLTADLYFKPDARDVYRMLMYKEWYMYKSVGIDSEYRPAVEARARGLLGDADPERNLAFARATIALLEKTAGAEETLAGGANDPAVGKAFAKRAKRHAGWFTGLTAPLKELIAAVERKDDAGREKALKDFINGLGGGK